MAKAKPLSKYHIEQIDKARKQVLVSVDRAFGFVTISSIEDGYDTVFLQGDDAAGFINSADNLFNNWSVSNEDAYYYMAYDYLDLIFHP